MNPRTYLNQFGVEFAIPTPILALVEQGLLVDTSWGNDVCPSFETADGWVRVWVAHPDARQRECPSPRFMIDHYTSAYRWELAPLMRTDDESELTEYLNNLLES